MLAWSRTGVAVMALGFVVARFGLVRLENKAEPADDLLAQLDVPGPAHPVTESQLEGIGLVGGEYPLHFLGQILVVDRHVDLVVADRAQAVKVGGSNCGNPAVRRTGL